MNDREIRELWNLLGQTWGSKFLEQYGTEPNVAWSAFLGAITPDAARRALRALVLEGSPFPPTLPEFVALARRHARDQVRAAQTAELLEAPKVDPARAAANLAKLRELLRS